MCIFLTKLAI